MKYILNLDSRSELELLYKLVMQGKFQTCIDRFEYTASKHVINIVDKVLDLYFNSIEDYDKKKLDPRNLYIENYKHKKEFVKNTLREIPKDVYENIEDKKQFIRDIAYPYRIKDETIKSLMEQKDKQELCDNCFEHRIYVEYKKTNNNSENYIVSYDMLIRGSIDENCIKNINIEIDRYLKDQE